MLLCSQIFQRFDFACLKRRIHGCRQAQKKCDENNLQNIKKIRMKRNVIQGINFCRKIDNLEIISQKTTEQTQNNAEENPEKP